MSETLGREGSARPKLLIVWGKFLCKSTKEVLMKEEPFVPRVMLRARSLGGRARELAGLRTLCGRVRWVSVGGR